MTKILYVEDNEDNIFMLERRLKKAGYETVIARDGQAGLDAVSSANPDLILLDLSLPKIDGWEVARRLKADDATREIPVIALTAHATIQDREEALDAGCDEFETKPVQWRRLHEVMKATLDAARRKQKTELEEVDEDAPVRRLKGLFERGPTVRISIDGEPVMAYEGETLAAVILLSGRRVFRESRRRGEPRGAYCAIGQCFDCIVTVAGRPNVRACQTLVYDGMRVETQYGWGEWRLQR